MKRFIVLLAALSFGAAATTATAQTSQSAYRRHASATHSVVTVKPDKTVTFESTTNSTNAEGSIAQAAARLDYSAPNATKLVAHHHRWERLVVGMKDNQDIADHIDASLARDPNGNSPLTPDRCQPNGDSCGTPNMLINLALKSDPSAKDQLTLKRFSHFVRSLVLIKDSDPPGSERWMGCIDPRTHRERWNCMSRPYDPDEKVYADPANMKPVVQTECVNFIGDIVEEHVCDYIYFGLHKSEEVGVGLAGHDALPEDVCRPALMKAGDTEWGTALLDECPRTNCSFEQPAADLKLPLLDKPRISFRAQVTGMYVLRVPRMVETSDDVFMFCVRFKDGTQTNPKTIKKTAYGSLWRAYIDFSGNELSKESREKIHWRGLVHVWEMSNQRAFKGARPD